MADRSTRIAALTRTALIERLSLRRIELARCAEALRTEGSDALRSRDISDVFDDESPTDDCDVATQLILVERAEDRIREIDEALERVADGTYGFCAGCGSTIPLERLRALPTTPECIECSAKSRGWDRLVIAAASGVQ